MLGVSGMWPWGKGLFDSLRGVQAVSASEGSRGEIENNGPVALAARCRMI